MIKNLITPVLYNEELQQLLDHEELPFEVIMEEWIEKNKEFEIPETHPTFNRDKE